METRTDTQNSLATIPISDSITESVLDMEKKVDRLEKQLDNVTRLLEEMRQENTQLINENKELSRKRAEHEGRIQEFRSEVDKTRPECEEKCQKYSQLLHSYEERLSDHEERMNDIEQYTRKNNVIISGVPSCKNENVPSMIADCARSMGVQLSEHDIDTCHRLPAKKNSKNPPNIIVRLVHRHKKNLLIRASKDKKPKLRNIGIQSDERIYLADHFTPRNAKLYYQARYLKRNRQIQYLWTTEGKIKARIKDGDPIIYINSERDL